MSSPLSSSHCIVPQLPTLELFASTHVKPDTTVFSSFSALSAGTNYSPGAQFHLPSSNIMEQIDDERATSRQLSLFRPLGE